MDYRSFEHSDIWGCILYILGFELSFTGLTALLDSSDMLSWLVTVVGFTVMCIGGTVFLQSVRDGQTRILRLFPLTLLNWITRQTVTFWLPSAGPKVGNEPDVIVDDVLRGTALAIMIVFVLTILNIALWMLL